MPELRQKLIATACRTMSCGLNKGVAGNLSVRAEENGEAGFLITPTGIAYAALEPADIVFMRFDGSATGRRKPSSE
ncbi:MAG: class aldolase/adducin family protein, partial [Proteobacteria bacterium]|nr:class aldolase/adducin family protein [Pseudomonadota bacterium]